MTRRLTYREVEEQYGGVLPPDAVYRPDDEPAVPPPPPTPPKSPLRSAARKGRANPVVRKLLGYRRFFDSLPTLQPRLTPGAVALWAWLWTCEKKGLVKTSERRLAQRFAAGRTTIRGRLAELEALRLIRRVRRGQFGRTASVFRIRPKCKGLK